MESEQIEQFIHAPGRGPRVATGAPQDTLRDLLIRLEIIREGADGLHIFVGECAESLNEADEVDNGADQYATVDINLTIADLGLRQHRHVHVHRCRHVGVGVNFDGKTKRHQFSPNTTAGVATDWARRKFHLDPALAGEFVLQLCGGLVQPRSDEHLGDLVQGDACTLCFDLVKESTPKG